MQSAARILYCIGSISIKLFHEPVQGRSSELWSTEAILWKNLVNAVVLIGLVCYELHESMGPAIEWEKRKKECKRR